MNTPKNLNGLLIALGVLVVFTVGAFFALGVKSVFTDTASAQLTAPNPGHNYDQIGLPEGTWTDLDADRLDGYEAADFGGGGSCYTNWNSADCAPGWTAVSTGEWTPIVMSGPVGGGWAYGTGMVCAAPKAEDNPETNYAYSDTVDGGTRHTVSHDPCAICCK